MEELQNKIPDHILKRLQNAKINSFQDFLTKPKIEICNSTKISEKDVKLITKIISEHILKSPFTKAIDLPDSEFLLTGCSRIDDAIRGIKTQNITEIYGESGSGKTQLALQLALQVQKSKENGGLEGGCIFICTEDIFPSKRLKQIKEYLPELATEDGRSPNYEDNVFIEHIDDLEQFKHCLSIRVPILISKRKIKLIIIDSIAGIFRYDDEIKNYITRSEDLVWIAQKLNDIACEHNLAVITINQITADPIEGPKPCLGLAWSNLIQTRYEISRTPKILTIEDQNVVVRRLKIIFSSFNSVNICHFLITKKGVHNI